MEKDGDEKTRKTKKVHSELAPPSRVGGHKGVHQPILPSAPVTPPETQPADAALARAVIDALAADGRVARCPIKVSVSRGVVTLDGDVEEEFQRMLAVAHANSVPGVLNVVSSMNVTSY